MRQFLFSVDSHRTGHSQSVLVRYVLNYRWLVEIDGAAGTLYEGEHFQLQFTFTDQYPFSSPEVRMAVSIGGKA